MEEEIIVRGNGKYQAILKSGKPNLKNISIAQWVVAELAIFYKLQGESWLVGDGVLDYQSCTTKICQLVRRYSIESV